MTVAENFVRVYVEAGTDPLAGLPGSEYVEVDGSVNGQPVPVRFYPQDDDGQPGSGADPLAGDPLMVNDEVVVPLPGGWSMRSGADHLLAGAYVRIVDPVGRERLMWEHGEWADDPELVMGAILAAASRVARNS